MLGNVAVRAWLFTGTVGVESGCLIMPFVTSMSCSCSSFNPTARPASMNLAIAESFDDVDECVCLVCAVKAAVNGFMATVSRFPSVSLRAVSTAAGLALADCD